MKAKISIIKREFEKLVNNSILERGIIIRNFSFNISGEIERFLDNVYDYIYGFSFYLFLPFSDNEYAYFSVSQSLKEPVNEESLSKVVEINNIEKLHRHLIFTDLKESLVATSFVVNPVPPSFSRDLEECKEYIINFHRLLNFVAVVRLIIRDHTIDFGYYEKVL